MLTGKLLIGESWGDVNGGGLGGMLLLNIHQHHMHHDSQARDGQPSNSWARKQNRIYAHAHISFIWL